MAFKKNFRFGHGLIGNKKKDARYRHNETSDSF